MTPCAHTWIPLSASLDECALCGAQQAPRWCRCINSGQFTRQEVGPPGTPAQLHPATTDLVHRFAAALREKLAAAEQKYGYSDNWRADDWLDECRAQLAAHVAKGDPRDVAAYCAFLWHHGASTAPQAPKEVPRG